MKGTKFTSNNNWSASYIIGSNLCYMFIRLLKKIHFGNNFKMRFFIISFTYPLWFEIQRIIISINVLTKYQQKQLQSVYDIHIKWILIYI